MTSTDLPIHPRTGLRALGWTSRGPIWPQMGGSGDAPASDPETGTEDGSGDQGQTPAQQPQQQQGQQQPAQPLGPDGQPLDPVRLQRLVENLRAEIATLKQRGQGQGQAPAPAQQATPAPQQQGQGDTAGQAPADDDSSAAELAAARAELAIYRAAGKHGADPAKLTDSRSFMDQVSRLPEEDRDKKLAELIKKTLDDHPHYRSGQAPGTAPRGGSDGTGRPGAPARSRDINGAVSAYYAKQ